MKTTAITILFTLLLAIPSRAEVIAQLDDYFKYPFIRMDQEKLYVFDKKLDKVFIYSAKTFKKVAEFGESGEGPAQFKWTEHAGINEKYIYISSFPKICFFDKKGTFIKEIKGDSKSGSFMPIGNGFVGSYYPPSDPKSLRAQITYNLYDEQLKDPKQLCTLPFKVYVKYHPGKAIEYFFKDCVKAIVYKSRIYVGSSGAGFTFTVFDRSGNRLYDINRPLKMKKVSEKAKKRLIAHMKKSYKDEWAKYKARNKIEFHKFFPPYEDFHVADDRLYVFEHTDDNGRKIHILDLKGQLIKEITLPEQHPLFYLSTHRGIIKDERFYRLQDNYDEEVWELHAFDIK